MSKKQQLLALADWHNEQIGKSGEKINNQSSDMRATHLSWAKLIRAVANKMSEKLLAK